VLLLSTFPGFNQLGFFALVTMLTAFFSDVVFTTSFMFLFYGWRRAFARAEKPGRGDGRAEPDQGRAMYPVADRSAVNQLELGAGVRRSKAAQR